MKDLEHSKNKPTPTTKTAQPVAHQPKSATHETGKEQLQLMSTEELVKMLKRHDMNLGANALLRQRIIMILQERKGNDFVERILEKESKQKSK